MRQICTGRHIDKESLIENERHRWRKRDSDIIARYHWLALIEIIFFNIVYACVYNLST